MRWSLWFEEIVRVEVRVFVVVEWVEIVVWFVIVVFEIDLEEFVGLFVVLEVVIGLVVGDFCCFV